MPSEILPSSNTISKKANMKPMHRSSFTISFLYFCMVLLSYSVAHQFNCDYYFEFQNKNDSISCSGFVDTSTSGLKAKVKMLDDLIKGRKTLSGGIKRESFSSIQAERNCTKNVYEVQYAGKCKVHVILPFISEGPHKVYYNILGCQRAFFPRYSRTLI